MASPTTVQVLASTEEIAKISLTVKLMPMAIQPIPQVVNVFLISAGNYAKQNFSVTPPGMGIRLLQILVTKM